MKRSMLLAACVIASVAHAGGDPIPVCVGSTGTLRLLGANQKCAAGEQRKLFAEWEEEMGEPPEEDKDDGSDLLRKRIDELTKRLAALEQDVQKREKNAQPNEGTRTVVQTAARVTAPFEVVGRNGKVILRVAEKVSSTTGNGAAVTIGAGDGGNYAVRVHKNGGTFVAGVGQSRDGHGLVVVMDQQGNMVANMSAGNRSVSVFDGEHAAASLALEEKGGTVAVYQEGQPVAYLTRSSHGNGGNLTLADGSGFGVFSAGSASDGGGEACLNRVTGGGKQRNVCLGVELPSMGLGK